MLDLLGLLRVGHQATTPGSRPPISAVLKFSMQSRRCWLHLPQLIQWRFVCPAKNLSLFFRPSDLIIVSSVFARPPSCCRFYGEDKVYWWLKTRYVHVVITLSWTWTRIRQRGGKFRNYNINTTNYREGGGEIFAQVKEGITSDNDIDMDLDITFVKK